MAGVLGPDGPHPVQALGLLPVAELELVQAGVVEGEGAAAAVDLHGEVARSPRAGA